MLRLSDTRCFTIKIVEQIEAFLKEEGLDFTYDDGIFCVCLEEEGEPFDLVIYCNIRDYTVHTVFPLDVDTDNKSLLAVMAEFIARANYVMKNDNGCLTMDYDKGYVSFKVYVDCYDGHIPMSCDLPHALIHDSFFTGPAVMTKTNYGCGLTGIISEGWDAQRALSESADQHIRYILHKYGVKEEKLDGLVACFRAAREEAMRLRSREEEEQEKVLEEMENMTPEEVMNAIFESDDDVDN